MGMRNYLIKLINEKQTHLTLNSNNYSNFNSIFEKFAKKYGKRIKLSFDKCKKNPNKYSNEQKKLIAEIVKQYNELVKKLPKNNNIQEIE